MKKWGWVLPVMLLILGACRKGMIEEKELLRRTPLLPRDPLVPMSLVRCISSYEDLVQVLGGNKVNASSVILANGITLRPGENLSTITYEAVANPQPNSLFNSQLGIQWRWPGADWQWSTADVWSLGCQYMVSGEPNYTNLIKGRQKIEINTCFFWVTDQYTGVRIDYIVLD